MAEGLNSHQSAEQEGNNDNIPNGDAENMDVDQQNAGGMGVNGEPVAGAGAGDGAAESQEERKITQTDHINKSLLTSFLSHLNNPAMSSQFPTVQTIDTDDDGIALAEETEQVIGDGESWN